MVSEFCIHKLRDARSECDSLLFTLPAGNFLELVQDIYLEKGGIEGQRAALKSKSALAIRRRLVEDLTLGAVIPPIVVGVLVAKDERERIWNCQSSEELLRSLKSLDKGSLSIIDGMQRTTSLIDAVKASPKLEDQPLRVELWITEKLGGLVYRMLILNTGQIPWEMGRQLETIYSQLLKSLRSEFQDAVEIFLRDDERRRTGPGQYQASTIVRLYLAFSARRAEFDIKDRVAEDFARLDAIEASSHFEFFSYFKSAFRLMFLLDEQFSRSSNLEMGAEKVRIPGGSALFKTEPALIGFFVALALSLFDAPGFEVDWARAGHQMIKIEKDVTALVHKINNLTPDEVLDFLQLDILNERMNQRSGQVGRFERDLFTRAFSFLLSRGDQLPSLKPCWLA